jgi:hypothetical protein
MNCDNTINSNRKSGVAQWRDLLFIIRTIESEWKRYSPLLSSRPSEASGGICSAPSALPNSPGDTSNFVAEPNLDKSV